MKYLLLLLLLLAGCDEPRTNKEIARLNELNKKLQEPENYPKPMTSRTYTNLQNTTVMKIVEPKDCFTSTEIEIRFSNIKDNKLVICDNNYWLPSRKFVENKLLPIYRSYIDTHKIVYSNKFDCDDFSRLFCVFSQSLYINLLINKSMEAISVAEVHFIKDVSILTLIMNSNWTVDSNHAINMVLLDDLTIMYIEPQTGNEIKLTDKEKASIFFCKF